MRGSTELSRSNRRRPLRYASNMSSQRSVQGVVRGRVQGVAYRASFQRLARSLGLTGWVRNQPDGSVAFLVQGELEDVQAMLSWAEQGPALARVDGVETTAVSHQADLGVFEILY